MPSYSGVWTLTAVYQAVGAGNWPPNYVPPIGLFAGGSASGSPGINVINYVNLATTGNATDFGELASSVGLISGCSNAHGGL